MHESVFCAVASSDLCWQDCVHICARASVSVCALGRERSFNFFSLNLLPPSRPTVVFLLLADPVKRRTSLKSSFSLFSFCFSLSLSLSFSFSLLSREARKKEKKYRGTAIDNETMHRKVRVNVTTFFGRFADSVNHQQQHRRS